MALPPLVLAFAFAVTGAPGWGWPLAPPHQVLARFAPPAHDWLPGHRGVDLAAVPGEVVVAAGAGRVSFAGRVGGIDVVAVRHPDGLETTYEPVRPSVRSGQPVGLGERLGVISGRLAHCSRPCLHWGLRRAGAYLDPLGLVGQARVRLLPLLGHDHTGRRAPPLIGAMSLAGTMSVASAAGAVAGRRRAVSRGCR